MKIFAWAADRAGCRYSRLQVPLDELRKRGHNIRIAEQWTDDWHDADVVIGQRVSRPGASRTWQASDRYKIFEIDDDLFNLDVSNPGYSFYTEDLQENLRRNIAAADRVTVSTQHLSDQLYPLNGNIFVLPNTIPDWVFDVNQTYPGQFTIGWAGSPTHADDWLEMWPYVKKFASSHSDVVLQTIGTDYVNGSIPNHEHVPWYTSVPELYRSLSFHVGLAPLRPTKFNRSKSFIKAIEYGARGIPIIASDFGPYKEYVRHGENGFLVKRPHEWRVYLEKLYSDPELWEYTAMNAFQMAQAYRTSAWTETYERSIGAHGVFPPRQCRMFP